MQPTFKSRSDDFYKKLEIERLKHSPTKSHKKRVFFEFSKTESIATTQHLAASRTALLADTSHHNLLRAHLKILRYGIPNIMSSGDYLIAKIVLKLIITSTEYYPLLSATDHHNTISEILVNTFNLGLLETLGIFGAQAFASSKKERLKLMLNQSLWISFVFFVLICFPIYYLNADFLRLYGVQDERSLVNYDNLTLYSLPAILLKLQTDCYKHFLYSQGLFSELGILCTLNLLLLPAHAYVLIVHFRLKNFGYGLSLVLLELGNVLICQYFQTKKIDKRTKKVRYTLRYNRGWYLCQWFKNSFTQYHLYLVIELAIYTIYVIGSQIQVQTISIFFNLLTGFLAVAEGLYIYPRTKLNYLIGKGARTQAKRLIFDYVSSFVILSLLISIFAYYGLKAGFGVFVVDDGLTEHLGKTLIWFVITVFLYNLLPIVNGAMRSIDKKIYLIVCNSLFSVVLLPFGIYWMSVTQNLEVVGVFLVMALDACFRLSINYFTLLFTDWSFFKIMR